MKKIVYFFLLLISIISCKNHNDPLKGFQLGSNEESWNKRITELKANKTIIVNEDSSLNSFLLIEQDSFKVQYKINEHYPSTPMFNNFSDVELYRHGKLRIVEIEFEPMSGLVKTNTVNKIVSYLTKMYGNPNTTLGPFKDEFGRDILSKVTWELKDFDIDLHYYPTKIQFRI